MPVGQCFAKLTLYINKGYRSASAQDPCCYQNVLAAKAALQLGLMCYVVEDERRFRLIGIGVADLESPDRADPADLVDPAALRRARAENAVDALRARFGGKAVETGYTFGRDSRARPQRDQD